MTVTHYWNQSEKKLTAKDEDINIGEHFGDDGYRKLFLESCAINSNAEIEPKKGSATEIAILKMLRKMGFDYQELRKKTSIIKSIPFNSERKRMSTIINFEGKKIVLLKGASEIVLASCNQWMTSSNGEVSAISPDLLKTMKDSITNMAKQSLRTLCLAYK